MQISILQNHPEIIHIADDTHFVVVRVTDSASMTTEHFGNFVKENPMFAMLSDDTNDWYFTIVGGNLTVDVEPEVLKIFSEKIFKMATDFWQAHRHEMYGKLISKASLN